MGSDQDYPSSPSLAQTWLNGEPEASGMTVSKEGLGEPGRFALSNGTPSFLLPASPESRSVARTTMTDVPMPAVSRSPRRLYCCCVNTGASSLTSSTYTITCGSRARGARSGRGGGWEVQGLARCGRLMWSLLSRACYELLLGPRAYLVCHCVLPPCTAPGAWQMLKHYLFWNELHLALGSLTNAVGTSD